MQPTENKSHNLSCSFWPLSRTPTPIPCLHPPTAHAHMHTCTMAAITGDGHTITLPYMVLKLMYDVVLFFLSQEAINLLEPMTNDPVNYVRQGALIASALIMVQQTEVTCPKVSKTHPNISLLSPYSRQGDCSRRHTHTLADRWRSH